MIGGDYLMLEQKKFFKGLGFEECEFEYPTGKRTCYKGTDGDYYRIDHFGSSYVIECAENEEEAKLNQFEDADLYDDSLPTNELIDLIQSDLKKYISD